MLMRAIQIISKLRVWIIFALVSCIAFTALGQGGGDSVYRVTIIKGAGDKEARDYKLMLESLGYIPVYITGDPDKGQAAVFYGNFPTRKDAEAVKGQLSREGFTPGEVVQATRGGDSGTKAGAAGNFTILAGEFKTEAEAAGVKKELEKRGQIGVTALKVGNAFRVTVGKFTSTQDRAQNVLAAVKEAGFSDARIVDAVSGTPVADASAVDSASAEADAREITKKVAAAQNLSPEQMKAVEQLIAEKMKGAGSGTVGGGVLDKIVELEQKLKQVGVKVDEIDKGFKEFKDQREDEARKRVTIAQLFRDSNNLSKGQKYEEAIVKIREILNMDSDNQLAQQRLRTLESLAAGGSGNDEGDAASEAKIQQQYTQLKADAEINEQTNTIDSLATAKSNWQTIKSLDPKYFAEADAKVASINSKLEILRKETGAGPGGNNNVVMALAGAVALLIIIVGFIIVRQRKHQKEMLEKLQEATSLRPMRGLPGGRRGSDWGLPPGAGGQLPSPDEYDPSMGGGMPGGQGGFAPMGGGSPQMMGAASGSSAVDDLFAEAEAPTKTAAAPPPPKAAKKPAAPPPAPVFEAPPAPAMASASSSSLDDILGGIGSAPAAAEPAAVSPLDEIFGSVNAPPKPAPKPKAEEHSSVSLDDILGMGSPAPEAAPKPAAAAAPSSLSFLDDIIPAAPPAAAPAAVNPLDDILNFGTPSAKSDPLMDIPALGSNKPKADPLAGLGFTGDETVIEPQSSAGFDLGSFGASSPEASETIGVGVAPSMNGEGFKQTFEADAIGAKPKGWDGDFPYATLTVQNDTPPANSKNYLVYNKKEGVGKVYYATKFPNVSGVVSVEFDLRCNDKNKFLLGFYIEKDEDFQQAIHTKILRSESQTAPSIHIHGQPAPYLLGTWARIKYVVDLNNGKVDGYVDGRHIAKSLSLPQVPKYLNTLAIRDNINTTGQLFIDNIEVKKVG